MRYQELNEKLSVNNIVETIKRDCQPFLKQSGGKFLYRGLDMMPNDPTQVLAMTPLKDRHPYNTSYNIHDAVNRYLNAKGFEADRGNSFFCTSDFKQAGKYGELFILFPKGNFDYTWSTKVPDFFEDVVHPSSPAKLRRNFENMPNEEFEELMDSLEYQNTDLPLAMDIGHEIMLNCDLVYFIHYGQKEMLEKSL